MIQLKSTGTLEVFLAGAVATTQPVLYASYVDIATDGTTYAPSSATGATNSTTAVTWLGSPASGAIRQIKYLSLYNADTAAVVATIRVVDNGTNRIIGKFTLAADERLQFVDVNGFTTAAAAGSAAAETFAYGVACSDMTTDLTTGTGKAYFRMPHAATDMTFRASLVDASSSGAVTVDINKNGSTILSTKLTIDATEKTSVTAAAAYVATSDSCSDDDEYIIDIDGHGADAKGLIVWFAGNKA